jgi:hypothetical protein
MRKSDQRRGRQRGSALLIAVVMIFVMVAMIELMMATPSAELQKVRSTVSKEHSLASADAGVKDALQFLYANRSNLTNWFTAPVVCWTPPTPNTAGYLPMYTLLAGSNTFTTPAGSVAATTVLTGDAANLTGNYVALMGYTVQNSPTFGPIDTPNFTFGGGGTGTNQTTTVVYPPGDSGGTSGTYVGGGTACLSINTFITSTGFTSAQTTALQSATLWTTDPKTGLYPFPIFNDTATVTNGSFTPNTNDQFVRFGDPVISRGEYAYMIRQLPTLSAGTTSYYYQIDVEGRAQGTTQAASGQTSKLVSRITGVAVITYPAIGSFGATNLLSTNSTPLAATISANDVSGGTSNTVGISGIDGSGVVTTDTPGMVIESGTGTNPQYITSSNNTVEAGNATAVGTGTSGSTSSQTAITSATAGQMSADTQIIQQAQTLYNAAAPGAGTKVTSSSPAYQLLNLNTADTATNSFSAGMVGLYYVNIPDGATITQPILKVSGQPNTTGGIMIINIGAGVNFNMGVDSHGKEYGLIQADGKHPFQGTVIINQTGAINDQTTTTQNIPLYAQNGASTGKSGSTAGLQFNYANIQSAFDFVQPPFKLVVYTIAQ